MKHKFISLILVTALMTTQVCHADMLRPVAAEEAGRAALDGTPEGSLSEEENSIIRRISRFYEANKERIYRKYRLQSCGITGKGGANVDTSPAGMENLWLLLKWLGVPNNAKFLDVGYNDASVVVTINGLGLDSSGIEISEKVAEAGSECRDAAVQDEELKGVLDPSRIHISRADFFKTDISGFDVIYFYFTPSSASIYGDAAKREMLREQWKNQFKEKLLGPKGLKPGARFIVKCPPDKNWLTEADGFKITQKGNFKIYQLEEGVTVYEGEIESKANISGMVLDPGRYSVTIVETDVGGRITKKTPAHGNDWIKKLKEGRSFVRIASNKTNKAVYLADNHGLLPLALRHFEEAGNIPQTQAYTAIDLDDHGDWGELKEHDTVDLAKASAVMDTRQFRNIYTFSTGGLTSLWVNMGNFWTYLAFKKKLLALYNFNLHNVRKGTVSRALYSVLLKRDDKERAVACLKHVLEPENGAFPIISAHLDDIDKAAAGAQGPFLISFCFDALNKSDNLDAIDRFAKVLYKDNKSGFIFGALSTNCCTNGVWESGKAKSAQPEAIM